MKQSAVLGAEAVLERVIAAFEQLPRLAAADADLTRRARFLSCEIELGIGAQSVAIAITDGRVVSVRRGPFLLKPWTFAIRAEPEVWLKFLEPFPVAGYHDLMALTKVGRARIEGDLVPFMGNLQVIKDLISLPRQLQAGGAQLQAEGARP